jgi:hypothetical protein
MGDAGSPYARFRRALATGNPGLAWPAAAELAQVSLDDALALVLLVVDESRYQRAAARWLGRLCVERPVTLDQAQVLAAALGALPDAAAAAALHATCDELGLRVSVRPGQPGH